jgi:hypothetical protein
VEGEDQADSQGKGREFALAQPSVRENQMNYRLLLAAAALPLAAMPTAAFAQDEEAEASGPITISGEVGVFSDYRFRGLSLTDHKLELTAELSVEHESGLEQSVDRRTDRPVDKGYKNSLSHFLHYMLRLEVGTHPPIPLVEIDIDDPTRAGTLQQRVVEHPDESTARREHPKDFIEACLQVADVLEHQARERRIKGRRPGRHGVCLAGEVLRPAAALSGDSQLRRGRVEPDNCGPARTQLARDLPLSRADIEHMPSVGEQVECQGDDLIAILRVGTVGEAIDPPRGVLLPELLTRRGHCGYLRLCGAVHGCAAILIRHDRGRAVCSAA